MTAEPAARENVLVLTSRSNRWVAGGASLVVALFALDVLTAATLPVSLFAVGPLLAGVGGSERATALVAALATAIAVLADAVRPGPLDGIEVARLITGAVIGGLAVVFAALRRRLEQRSAEADEANRRAQEALALLERIYFDHGTVGFVRKIAPNLVQVANCIQDLIDRRGRPPIFMGRQPEFFK